MACLLALLAVFIGGPVGGLAGLALGARLVLRRAGLNGAAAVAADRAVAWPRARSHQDLHRLAGRLLISRPGVEPARRATDADAWELRYRVEWAGEDWGSSHVSISHRDPSGWCAHAARFQVLWFRRTRAASLPPI
jgi:hypothetical protein